MVAIINFIFFVVGALLQLLIYAIVASAIISWLVAFNVINVHNPFINNVLRALDAVTRPVLRPFQRMIPPLGGVDLSPIVAIIILVGIQSYLLPALHNGLVSLVSPPLS
jgi:YggT family protein